MMRESFSGSKRDRAMMQGQKGSDKGKFHSAVRMTAAICILCLLLAACGMSIEEQWQEQYDLGQQYLLDGDYEQAIVAFTAAIEIDPIVADAYLGRAEAYIGGDIGSASTENLNLALADYDAAIELDEALTEAFVSRGDVHVVLGTEEDLEEAISDYSSAISLDDTKAEYYVRRGDVYIALGSTEDLEEAISDYTSAITLDDTNAEVYVSRGDTYVSIDANSEENLTAAIADYDSAIALDDTLTELYLTEAALYIEIGDYAGAVEAYTNAIEAGLRDSEGYLGRANAYYELAKALIEDDSLEGDGGESSLTEEALVYLQAALDDFSTVLNSGDTAEDIYLTAAEICILIEDYEQAAEILEEGLARNPESAALFQKAEEVAEIIVELEYQEYLISIQEELGEAYMDVLLELTETLETDFEALLGVTCLGEDFLIFAQSLDETFLWEQQNGWFIAIYSNGFVYYGEMEDGLRSGIGYGYMEFGGVDLRDNWGPHDIDVANEVYYGEWSNDLPNGAGEYYLLSVWDGDISNGWEIWCYDINFTDGYVDGSGIFRYSDADGMSGECVIQAEGGEMIGLYDGADIYNDPLFSGMYAFAYIAPYYWYYTDPYVVYVFGAE